MTVQTTSAYNWPDINKPHPCNCRPKDKGPVMVTVKAKAEDGHAWQLFTGTGDGIGYAEDDAMNHAVEWFGSNDILFGDEPALPVTPQPASE